MFLKGIDLRMFPLGRSQGQFRVQQTSVVSDGAVFQEVECGGTIKGKQRETSSDPKRKEV